MFNIPVLGQLRWIVDGEIWRSLDGGTLSARVIKSGSEINPLFLKADWNGLVQKLFFISAEIFTEIESFFSLNANSALVNR